jgi:YihY family inner membrane protein
MDRFQRRHPVIGFPLAVVYKFFEDQGGYLAAALTYYAFVAIFPLLLIASSVLGFFLQGDPTLQQEILDSALSQFPIVGDQLGRPEGLQGSTSAVVVGIVTALYGVIGLGQAGQNLVNTAWSVPRNSRLDPLRSRARSLLLLTLAGTALLATTVFTSLGSHIVIFGSEPGAWLHWSLQAVALALNAAVLTLLFWLARDRAYPVTAAVPGAVLVAVLWQVLQVLGGVYVEEVIRRAGAMNGTFALVLGLMGLIYIAAVIAVFGIEVTVVLGKRLFPRALLTPFTDRVSLTEADRRAYADYAKAQRHKGFESVHVTFAPRDGDTHERDEAPPSSPDSVAEEQADMPQEVEPR